MYRFSAYGCSVRSNIDLPGFAKPGGNGADVIVRLDPPVSPVETTTDPSIPVSIHGLSDGLRIDWGGVASYIVTKGREIIISPRDNNSSVELLSQPVYGMAFAAILQQQQHLILHGSSVEIEGKSLVILGGKGFGKSTLTAFLLSNGHRFICDDVTALLMNSPEIPQALPGIPRLRLLADAVNVIGQTPDTLPLAPLVNKHILSVKSKDFATNHVPLHTILLLSHGDIIALHKMSDSEKMLCLLGGQYFAKYHNMIQPQDHKRIFNQCEMLAKSTNIIRLTAPRDLRLLPETAQLLEKHMC